MCEFLYKIVRAFIEGDIMEEIMQKVRTEEEFFKLVEPLEAIAQGKGFAKGIITAQIALETGYGKKIIDRNLFNIKATGDWITSGNYVVVGTTEYEGGIAVKQPAMFRKYQSYGESLKDYLRLISTVSSYSWAWKHRSDPYEYFKGLVRGGYATDPIYSEKLNMIYENLYT